MMNAEHLCVWQMGSSFPENFRDIRIDLARVAEDKYIGALGFRDIVEKIPIRKESFGKEAWKECRRRLGELGLDNLFADTLENPRTFEINLLASYSQGETGGRTGIQRGVYRTNNPSRLVLWDSQYSEACTTGNSVSLLYDISRQEMIEIERAAKKIAGS